MKLAEARARSALVRGALRGHPGVRAVGVGEKHRGGVTQKHYAAIVLVDNKDRPTGPLLPPAMQTARGPMPLDVLATPDAAFHVANGLIDGGDLLINGFQTEKGTLALVSQRPGHSAFAVTNAHVVTRPDGNAVGQSVLTVMNGVRTRIGAVVGHSPYRTDALNHHDVALIRLDPGAAARAAPMQIDGFPGFVIGQVGRLNPSPHRGARKAYFYASMASGRPETVRLEHVVELPAFEALDGGATLPFARVFRLTATRGQVRAGHSGAALVRPVAPGVLLLVGLLFAGRGHTAFALSWHDIDDALAGFGA